MSFNDVTRILEDCRIFLCSFVTSWNFSSCISKFMEWKFEHGRVVSSTRAVEHNLKEEKKSNEKSVDELCRENINVSKSNGFLPFY